MICTVNDVCVHAQGGLVLHVATKMGRCVNQLRTGATSVSVSADMFMVSSNKKDDNGLDSTAHMIPGIDCASDPMYVVDTINT